jgi:hypothetical protein
MFDTFLHDLALGALMALKPMNYLLRLCIAVFAFGAAMNAEKVVARVIGFVWLLIAGAGFLFMGITRGTIVDLLFGAAALGAAGYSWWFTRS